MSIKYGNSHISSIASKIADTLNYQYGNIIDVVESLGGNIEVDENRTIKSEGSIEARSANDFTIYLSPYTSSNRDIFTIAHEIGHLVLHGVLRNKFPIVADRNGETSGKEEWEANYFAGCFLMPEEVFKELSIKMSNQQLAHHFSVSVSAIETRKRVLQLSR